MARHTILLACILSLFSFLVTNLVVAQSLTDADISQAKFERNYRAIQTYVKDEVSYFEGFMECKTYAEKSKLLKEIENTVKAVEKFSSEVDNQAYPVIDEWRSKAHFLNGIAYGLLGDKRGADIKMTESDRYLIDQADAMRALRAEEVRLADSRRKLSDIEMEMTGLMNDLATVNIRIKPEGRQALGFDLRLKMLTKPTAKYPQHIPFVLADAENKMNGALQKLAQRETVYLPKGRYEIYRPQDQKIIAQFEVQNVNKPKSVALPSSNFPTKFVLIGLGVLALAAVGYFAF